LSFKINRPALTRRSIIAASAGLAASTAGGNFFALAQDSAPDDSDMPPAADVIQQAAPTPAPNLHFTDAAGRKLTLDAFRGRGLVVNLWATWCGPCVAEFPTLAAIAPQLALSKILVLPISIDAEGLKVVQPFYQTHAIRDVPILLDPDGSATDALNAAGIPITIIIDTQGRLVGTTQGASNWNTPRTIRLIQRLTGGNRDTGGIEPV
jgi:thiol-disulfide isomerase/thioredoxin